MNFFPFTLHLQGPGGVWCEVDVVEFAYFGTPEATPTEQLYTELVDGLGGNDPCIGSGSQVFVKLEYNKLSTILCLVPSSLMFTRDANHVV